MADELRGFGKFVKVKQGPHENDYHDAAILLIEKIINSYQLGALQPDQWKTICRMLYCPETRGGLVKVMKETAQIYNDAVENNKVSMETKIYVERQLRVYKDFMVSFDQIPSFSFCLFSRFFLFYLFAFMHFSISWTWINK